MADPDYRTSVADCRLVRMLVSDIPSLQAWGRCTARVAESVKSSREVVDTVHSPAASIAGWETESMEVPVRAGQVVEVDFGREENSRIVMGLVLHMMGRTMAELLEKSQDILCRLMHWSMKFVGVCRHGCPYRRLPPMTMSIVDAAEADRRWEGETGMTFAAECGAVVGEEAGSEM